LAAKKNGAMSEIGPTWPSIFCAEFLVCRKGVWKRSTQRGCCRFAIEANQGEGGMPAGLAQMLAEKGIRANAVAPGPIWTPLIPSTLPQDSVVNFGKQVPMKHPGQPAELATAFVMLADPMSSYVSGATIAVTGGKPIL
jgi:Enoyl-(Acyl carrier protein) reductase